MEGINRVVPILDQVLVEQLEGEEKTKGGLFIPPTARNNEPVFQGVVKAVGPGRFDDQGRRIKPSVKKDDVVIFGRYAAGRTLDAGDGKKYIFIHEGEILGYVK